jgi:hypothetical protein
MTSMRSYQVAKTSYSLDIEHYRVSTGSITTHNVQESERTARLISSLLYLLDRMSSLFFLAPPSVWLSFMTMSSF